MQEPVLLIQISQADLAALIQEAVRIEFKTRDLKDADNLISADQVCELWHPKLSKRTLSRYVSKGLIIQYRIGGRVSYKRSEVMQASKELKRYESKRV